MNDMKENWGVSIGIFAFFLFLFISPTLTWAENKSSDKQRISETSLFRIVYHTKGLYIQIPVESVDRHGTIVITKKKVLVSKEALYFNKEGILDAVSYYQKSGDRELLLRGPYEYRSGGLAQRVSLGYFPYSSSIPEGLTFCGNRLVGSKDVPLQIDDVFPPLLSHSDLKLRVAK